MAVETSAEEKEIPQRTINIKLIRHGPKDESGLLSSEAQELIQQFASSLPIPQTGYLFYSSDIQRSISTADIVRSSLAIHLPVKVDELLSEAPLTDEKISELGLDGGRWLLLNLLTDKLPSIEAFAGKTALFIKNLKNDLFDKKEGSNIIAVSHVPPIMAFLGFVVADSVSKNEIDLSVKDRIHTIFDGGFPKPLEGFDVNMVGENMTLSVRGFVFKVSEDLLNRLIERYNTEFGLDK